MGLKRLSALIDVDLDMDYKLDLSTLEKAKNFVWEELAAEGGRPEVSVIPVGRFTAEPESQDESREEYQFKVLIVRDKTRPLAAANLYLHSENRPQLSAEKIESRWKDEAYLSSGRRLISEADSNDDIPF